MVKTDRHNLDGGTRDRVGRARSAGGAAGKALLLATFLACGLFFAGSPAVAATAGEAEEANPAPVDTSKQELLLFWEEKELYVETATRTAKPISQVAENMEVVTARDILEMNAHNLAEVLKRVPGMFLDIGTGELNSSAGLSILGSDPLYASPRHVTVLVDGVLWNSISGGGADVSTIPVEIIERIEIIKGAASSAWGSGLGGVINVITKATGDNLRPQGSVSASYGQKNTQDYHGETFGKAGALGYYLFAGHQYSDGLSTLQTGAPNRPLGPTSSRQNLGDSFYGKLSASPTGNLDLTFTLGFSDPELDSGLVAVSPTVIREPKLWARNMWITGSFDYRITPEFSVKGGAYTLDEYDHNVTRQFSGGATTVRTDRVTDEQTEGANLKLVYTGENNTAVVGSDVSYGGLDQNNKGTLFTSQLNKWALFANDTLVLGKVSVTPGLRLDHNNLSGSFLSPSVGVTCELGEHAIARGSVARGFTSPSLSMLSGGGLNPYANPNLTAEHGWIYQVGVESAAFDYLNVKGNLFRADLSNMINTNNATGIAVNGGVSTRQGYEVSVENAPVYNLSVKAAHAFAHVTDDLNPTVNVYNYLIVLKYDDRKSIVGELAGTYTWLDSAGTNQGQYNSFLWDLNLTKKFTVAKSSSLDVFFNVHNIFNTRQYSSYVYPNPDRWVEGGVRFNF